MDKQISNYGNSIDIIEKKSIKNTSLYINNVKLNTESYEYKILSEESIDNILGINVTKIPIFHNKKGFVYEFEKW